MEKLGKEYNAINKNLPVYNKYLEVLSAISEAEQILKPNPTGSARTGS
jgi:hypothetical protein